jgi:thiol-disulfide isomerase/thioredoxin
MGGLPAVTARLSPCAGAATLAVTLASLGCESREGTRSKSRVQAVLAEPGSAAPNRVTLQPEPAPASPAKPRPVLCEGQLDEKPAPFKPKAVPVRVSRDGGDELDRDPLERPGGRWTWVNFWAAWCVPCQEELPLLFRWQKALDQEVRFRFVSFDDDERQLRDFLAREPAEGLTASYWLPDGATRQAWLEALKLEAEPELPLQLLLDPKGMLRCRVQGAVEAADLAVLERIVARR